MFERRAAEPVLPVLDTAYLARLSVHVGSSVLAELLADGLIELTDRLARLGELHSAEDWDGIARLGHDLVGMAGHLGLARLSTAAAEMNRAARETADVPGGGRAGLKVARVRHLGAGAVVAISYHLDEVASR